MAERHGACAVMGLGVGVVGVLRGRRAWSMGFLVFSGEYEEVLEGWLLLSFG